MRNVMLWLVCAAMLGACHRTRVAVTQAPVMSVDSLRGTVVRTGAEPVSQLVLTTGPNTCRLITTGATASLRSTEGLELVVYGHREATSACAFTVERYEVRAMGGVPALDGILRNDGAQWSLELADGRRVPLASLPAALRGRTGARIFWAGPTDRAPAAYGELTPP